MKKMNNAEHIEGRIYQTDLTIRKVQDPASKNYNKEYIAGNIEVAVDEDGLNVIPVHYTFVTEITGKGKPNRNFATLKKIIEENKTWVTVGKDEAIKVKIDTALALNDFYDQNDTLVSVKRNEGGFVTIVTDITYKENERNTFNVDMIITGATRIEEDPERNIVEQVRIKGGIFDYRNSLLPLDLIVKNPEGMDYFESLEASSSDPVFTRVWGNIVCETQTRTVEEDSAFGAPAVRTYERKTKEWVVTGTAKVPYDFGDESILTADELKKAAQDREVMLAGVKQGNDKYKKSKNVTSTQAATTITPAAKTTGTFNF